MSSLTVRRIIVWVVSLALGFLVTALFITVILPWMGPNSGYPISIAKFGNEYFLVASLPIGLIFVVWLDHFLDAHILPD